MNIIFYFKKTALVDATFWCAQTGANSRVCLWPQVLSVTYVRAGSALNVIPPHVEFGGTLRSLTTEGLHQLRRRLKEVLFVLFPWSPVSIILSGS